MSTSAGLRTRNLRTLALLAALFLLPVVVAFVTYYGTSWRPAGRVNHGVLLAPPRALPGPFRGHWSLVYVGSGVCLEDCRATLSLMRQTRLGLGSEMARVARVFVASGECCDREYLAREHAGLEVLDASTPADGALLAAFPVTHARTLFVVDPLGNLILSYDAGQNPRGLLEDLKKLLRLSQIG